MMKQKVKIIVFLLLLIFIVFLLVKGKNNTKDINEHIPDQLKNIYSASEIKFLGDSDHYIVDSKEFFAKELKIGDSKLFVTVENYQNQGSIYRFYSSDLIPKLLKEIDSYVFPENSQQVFTRDFFIKDITGDGVEELFIKLQTTGSNLNSYEVFRLEKNNFINIKLNEKQDNWIEFDEISYKDGYIYSTLHDIPIGGYSVWETRYRLDKNILIPIEIIEFSLIKGTQDYCEIARSDDGGKNFIVIGEEKCSFLGRNFDNYFDEQ